MTTLIYGMAQEVFNGLAPEVQASIKEMHEAKAKAEADLAKSQQKRIQEGLNQVTLQGRTGDDVELKWKKQTDNEGKVTESAFVFFQVAVPMFAGAHKPTWVPVSVWGKQAEAVAKYVGKGSLITVTGVIENRKNDDGSYYTGVRAEQRTGLGVIFGDLKAPGGGNGTNTPAPVNNQNVTDVTQNFTGQAPAPSVIDDEVGF